jgi:hypothetical protein
MNCLGGHRSTRGARMLSVRIHRLLLLRGRFPLRQGRRWGLMSRLGMRMNRQVFARKHKQFVVS